MKPHIASTVLAIACSLSTLTAPAASRRTAPPELQPPDDFSHPSTTDWPMVGGDWTNSRYSASARIHRSNIQRLGLAWTSKDFSEGATSRVTPVVKNGRMFVTAGRSVYALDAGSGVSLWTYNTVTGARTNEDTPSAGKPVTSQVKFRGLPNWKGVGVGAGLVFVGLTDGNVIALRQQTGELVWTHQTGVDEPKSGQWAAVAPTYINGIVLTGLADGDHNQRGRMTAIDANTGQRIWQTFAVPAPGEPGHETWPSTNDAWSVGGGGVWTNPPVDPELGLAYFTSGNPVPAYAGDVRPGLNLYTGSVLAVEIKTGRLRWYYQLVHHDVFEADVGTPIVLYDTLISAKPRKGLAVLRADGYLFHLDRETGMPLRPIEERPVPQSTSQMTFPTQPFPVGGESILMNCDEWSKERIPAGFVVGCAFAPPPFPPPSLDPQNVLVPTPWKGSLLAYSPRTNYFYAQGVSILQWRRRSQDPYFLNWVGLVPRTPAYGEFAAIDARTGKIVWSARTSATSVAGSPLVTASGLVFRSSVDGNVEGYDAKTGDVLWRYQTGITNSGPPALFEANEEQFLSLVAGVRVFAFKIGGRRSTTAAPATPTDDEFRGPIIETDKIETASLHHSLIDPGNRYFVDEFSFNPSRARVWAGKKLLFVNNGLMLHEILARDGSWTTGPIGPAQEAWIAFDTPGQLTYICKQHPWSYGQILVEPEEALSASDRNPVVAENSHDEFREGKLLFREHCSLCHGEDLRGRGPAPALIGANFTSKWERASATDLLNNVRTTMPQTRPGSLKQEAYIEIVAYLLRENSLSLREAELRNDHGATKPNASEDH